MQSLCSGTRSLLIKQRRRVLLAQLAVYVKRMCFLIDLTVCVCISPQPKPRLLLLLRHVKQHIMLSLARSAVILEIVDVAQSEGRIDTVAKAYNYITIARCN